LNAITADEGLVRDLASATSADRVSTRAIDRRHVATDQWPAALLSYRQHVPVEQPLCVVSPETVDEVKRVVEVANKHRLGIVPYGAGSGVVGGGWAEQGAITVDMKRMRKVLSLDHDRLVCEAEGGIIGQHLENHLRRHGLTLGHFPSSIICSSLGGWLVGRSAGQFSCRYGKIEDMVLSLRTVDGTGRVSTFGADGPLPGPGPDDLQTIVGSEGMLSIVTDAKLRVWPKPAAEHYWGFQVSSVGHGIEAMRSLLQAGFSPTVLRLYDKADTVIAKRKADGAEDSLDGHGQMDRIASALPAPARESFVAALKKRAGATVLRTALLNPSAIRFFLDRASDRCNMILGCEGSERLSQAMMEGMRTHLVKQGATDLGKGPGIHWYHSRHNVSYKQSPVFLLGAFVDTMEVSAPWQHVVPIYNAVRDALRDRVFVMAHFSHAYLDGCALYFTFAGMSTGDELAFYKETWRRALEAVTTHGGSVSHHHGVGLAKHEFLADHHGPLWERFADLKKRFDPHGTMNRGKW
jgi:alkyldihydroxyacetonephosphate synthase